jgi:hypothetical protein
MKKKTQPIWHLFVEKSLDILADGGYLVMVHPSGWRYIDGSFRNIFEMFKNKQMLYLELHSKSDGQKTFGASTTYDFYCLKNCNNKKLTKIKFQDGVIGNYDLSKLKFIPNGKIDVFVKLMASDDEDKVNVLYNRSSYGTDKKNMSSVKTDEFKYPCIYYTYADGTYKLWYSSRNNNGHFKIPKVIFSSGISTPLIDSEGEFGQCQFAYGIIDSVNNLEDIKTALLNDKFLELMKYVDGVSGQRYNYKIIATFRKDFYKQFLND